MKATVDGFTIARLIAAGALVLAVRRWPYSYYTVLRWAVCIIATYGAFRAFDSGRKTWHWILGELAVLFNPVAPIYFARETWTMLDFLAALVLLISVPGLRSGTAPLK
jgi:hypothetical protein